MNIKTRNILFGILIIIVIIIFFLNFHKGKNPYDKTAVNENVIQIKDFSVKSDSAKQHTSAKGTIFIKGPEGAAEHVKIVANVEVDPDDWGGVSFYIPKNWYVSSIISSYPENEDRTKSSDYVSVWSTASDRYEWDKLIEIGRSSSYKPTGGGTGIVVIDLDIDERAEQHSETFNIIVAVGSDEKDGIKIVESDSTSIEIP